MHLFSWLASVIVVWLRALFAIRKPAPPQLQLRELEPKTVTVRLGDGFVGKPLSRAENKRLNLLRPEVRAKACELIANCAARGVRLYVGSTARTPEQQKAGEAAGRSATLKSWHLLNRAIDFYVRVPGGEIDLKARRVADYELMHEEAQKLGFRVLGFRLLTNRAGKKFRDPFHVEYRGGFANWDKAAKADGYKA